MLGCTKVSAGCKNCYAEGTSYRISRAGVSPRMKLYSQVVDEHGKFNGEVRVDENVMDQPSRWKRPRMIFVNSMSDLFHPGVPDEVIWRVWAEMAKADWHTYQVLTKRIDRAKEMLNRKSIDSEEFHEAWALGEWPLPNVWIGATVENQEAADNRIWDLRDTPAAARFLSCEPLIEETDLEYPKTLYPDGPQMCCGGGAGNPDTACGCMGLPIEPPLIHGIDWVIVGGESGPRARPMHARSVRKIRDACRRWKVAFYFKQWGEWIHDSQVEHIPGFLDALPDGDCITEHPWVREIHTWEDDTCSFKIGKKRAGKILDGEIHNEMPKKEKSDAR